MKLFQVDGKRNIGALLLSIIIAEGIGILSGFLGMSNTGFYGELQKPSFSPPGWVFPIVWVVLYFLMATAVYRVWLKAEKNKQDNKALILYGIQLFLNFLWTILFFRLGLRGIGFFELMLLLIFVLLTTFEFYKKDKTAAYLMIPYILWVSFAGVLNYAIWMLNR